MLSSVLFSCVRASYGGYVELRSVSICCVEFRYVLAVESSWGLMSSVPLRRLSLVVFGWALICQVTVINFK